MYEQIVYSIKNKKYERRNTRPTCSGIKPEITF